MEHYKFELFAHSDSVCFIIHTAYLFTTNYNARYLLPWQAYVFKDYWEDIGTIKSFYEANLALTDEVGSIIIWMRIWIPYPFCYPFCLLAVNQWYATKGYRHTVAHVTGRKYKVISQHCFCLPMVQEFLFLKTLLWHLNIVNHNMRRYRKHS